MKPIKAVIHKFGKWYCSAVCKKEYQSQEFMRINERPVEFAFIFRHLVRISPKKILDVGTGITALPHLMRNCGFLVTAIDNVKDYWQSGMFNRHFYIIDDDITNVKLTETFDVITCISVLEHIKEFDIALDNLYKLLCPGGSLIVTFPYSENTYIPNVYNMPDSSYGQDASYVCHSFSRNEIVQFVNRNSAEIIDQEYWQYWDKEFWTCGNQILPPRQVSELEQHQLTCIVFKKLAKK